jgi:hypothetical protein
MKYALVAAVFIALAVGYVLARRPASRGAPPPREATPQGDAETSSDPVVPEHPRAARAAARPKDELDAKLQRKLSSDVSGVWEEILDQLMKEGGVAISVDGQAAKALAGLNLTLASGQTVAEALDLIVQATGNVVKVERHEGQVLIKRR